jgi:CTP synthase (UTP-ammonia lyase)
VISKLVCSLVGQRQMIQILPDSLARQAYGTDQAQEEFRCNYGLNNVYRERVLDGALRISGLDPDGEVRMIELSGKRFFLATLFLPQLHSEPGQAHPLINAYLKAALAALD